MDIDHEYTGEVVCPWCGYEHTDSNEFFESHEDRSEGECSECGKPMRIERDFRVSYTTHKKEGA